MHCTYFHWAGISGFQQEDVSIDKVDVGKFLNFVCGTTGHVYGNTDKYVKALCQTNGDLAKPGNVDAADCRAPVDCNSTIPKPTVESHLLESTSTGLKEYDEAVFKCKDGYTLLDSGMATNTMFLVFPHHDGIELKENLFFYRPQGLKELNSMFDFRRLDNLIIL